MVEEGGRLVPRLTPEAQGAALFHLGRARQTATWPALQEEGTPTLLLLATEPESALRADEEGRPPPFKAVGPPGEEVRQLAGGSANPQPGSNPDPPRVAFGQVVAEWLAAAGSAAIE